MTNEHLKPEVLSLDAFDSSIKILNSFICNSPNTRNGGKFFPPTVVQRAHAQTKLVTSYKPYSIMIIAIEQYTLYQLSLLCKKTTACLIQGKRVAKHVHLYASIHLFRVYLR